MRETDLIPQDKNKDLDLILLGRVTIDFNPSEEEAFGPIQTVKTFKKYVGGSPANIACGVNRHGLKTGFIGKVSDDQFGDFVIDFFNREGIDTSQITRSKNGEKLGLTFTEMLSEKESNILMYRNEAADLKLDPSDVKEKYIQKARAILISGTALAQSPSREAALKAALLGRKNKVTIIFDIDYRPYNWKSIEEIAIYYQAIAKEADIIIGSREEFDLTEALVAPGMTDEESAEYWQSQSAKIVVIKHGKKGSTAYTKDKSFSIKSFPVNTRKGFGGGDGYASAFLYGIFSGWNIQDCLEFGSAEASMMVRSNNCSEDLPTTEEVREFIQKTKEEFGEMVARNECSTYLRGEE